MKPSTKKAIDETTARLKGAGLELTEAGFKYHSERLWLGVTTDADIVRLEIDKDGNAVTTLLRNDYAEAFVDGKKPAKKKGK